MRREKGKGLGKNMNWNEHTRKVGKIEWSGDLKGVNKIIERREKDRKKERRKERKKEAKEKRKKEGKKYAQDKKKLSAHLEFSLIESWRQLAGGLENKSLLGNDGVKHN